MATTIGKLSVMVSANTAKFSKGLKRARKRLTAFGGAIKTMGLRVAKFGAIAGAAAVGGMVLLVRQSFKVLDALAKTADMLGTTTEALAGLQHAATITGVSAQQFNMVMRRFIANLGEAAGGTGEAVEELKTLGVDAKALSKLPLDVAFGEVAEAINQVSSQTRKAAIAYKLFGGRGLAILNTLKVGKKGLADFKAEAIKLGIALDRESTAKIEAANDAMTRLKAVFTGLANTIAVELSPYIKGLADHLTKVGTEGKGSAGLIVDAFDLASQAMAAYLNIVRDIRADLKLLGAGIADTLDAAYRSKVKFREALGLDATNARGWAEYYHSVYRKLSSEAGAMMAEHPGADLLRTFTRLKDEMGLVAANADNSGNGIDLLTEALERAAKAAAKLKLAGARTFEQTRTPIERFELRIDELDKQLAGGAISWDTYGRAVKMARAQLEGPQQATKGIAVAQTAALQAGTAEAFSAARGVGYNNPILKTARDHLQTAKIQEAIERAQLAHLRKIAEAASGAYTIPAA